MTRSLGAGSAYPNPFKPAGIPGNCLNGSTQLPSQCRGACHQSSKGIFNIISCYSLLQVVLGFAFRMYVWLTTSLNIHTKTCYTVNRGYNQPPVQSCEGKGII